MTTPPNPNHPHNWLSNVDDRFFFNKSMVQDLIDLNDTRSHAWVTPFIQGFVETQNCNIAEENSSTRLVIKVKTNKANRKKSNLYVHTLKYRRDSGLLLSDQMISLFFLFIVLKYIVLLRMISEYVH